MNTTLLHRLVWKELRTLRPLWLSVLGIGIGLQFFYLLLFDVQYHALELRQAWFGTAIVLPIVLGLAGIAMAFAGEREEGTDQFLCRLGVPPNLTFVVKVAVNLAGAFALFWVMLRLATMLSQHYLPSQYPFDWIVGLLMRMLGFAWAVGLFVWGTFFSLMFRRVLPCLIAAVVATTVTMSFVDADLREKGNAGLRLLGIVSATLMLLSFGLVQRWDEGRWPRVIERLAALFQTLSRLRLRAASADGPEKEAIPVVSHALRREIRSLAGIRDALLRWVGLGRPDEWLPAWRREARRLFWLEWRSAWWVFLGLIPAACVALLALLGTARSDADMRFVMATFPVTLACVAFAMGVWSFQGQQREQRFRFFAAQGASSNAMWLTKHVVWLSFAIVAVLFLLGFAALISTRAIGWDEFSAVDLRNLIAVVKHDAKLHWTTLDRSELSLRLVYLAARATGTTPTETFEPDEVVGAWPLVSLLWLSLSRGVLAVWLCFAIGQLVALVIPRAVTASLVGVFPLGVAIGWWFLMSFFQVPLLIAVCPVLVGVLAAAWGRMNDWLEERSSWRRWVRVAATLLAPTFVAFAGMAAYRVYEIPVVALPFQKDVPSAEARRTGEEWMRLAEQLDSPIAKRAAAANDDEGVHPPEWQERLSAVAAIHWEDFRNEKWLAANAPILNEALQLAQRSDCVMPKSWEPWHDRQNNRLGRLALLIKMSAFESLANHRLDEALQRALAMYRFGQHLGGRHNGKLRWQRGVEVQKGAMHVLREWAMSSDQTEESLLAALGRSKIEQLHPVAQLVRAEGRFAVSPLETLQADYSEAIANHDERYRQVLPAPFRWMFWEQTRGERVLNVLAQEGINNLNHGMTRLSWQPEQQRRSAPYGRLLQDQSELLDRVGLSYPPSRGERWRGTSADSQHEFHWDEQSLAMDFFPVLGSLETQRRGLWLTIALQAYRVKHGRLPDRLEDLVGRYLDRLPSDPFNGLPFEYRPNGYPFVVQADNRRLAANTPLFAALGESASRREPVTAEHFFASQGRGIVDDEKVWLPGDLMWVSIRSQRLQWGEMEAHPYSFRPAAFSLKPSF